MEFSWEYTASVAEALLKIDSPSGFTQKVEELIGEYAGTLGYPFQETKTGCGVISVQGRQDKTVALCAHVDTLGLMVRGFHSDGTLTFTVIGGPIIPTLDGEYCRVYTRAGKVYTGTILSDSPSSHVFTDASELKRTAADMHIRLDEVVKSPDDVKALGIQAGDYICYDPKTVVTESGFIKSRFLDDKLSVAILIAVLRTLRNNNIVPEYHLKFYFSSYEEVGHGMSYLSDEADEVLAVDMGCIGSDLSCTEYDVSICAKDSSGPYDYQLTSRLIELARENGLSYAVDVYPYYSSDASAAIRSGNNVRTALIGPGVHASHGMERSHKDAAENTYRLLMAYLLHLGER